MVFVVQQKHILEMYMCYTCLCATKFCSMNLSYDDQIRTLCLLSRFSQVWFSRFFSFWSSNAGHLMVVLFLAPSSLGKFPFDILQHFVPSNISPKLNCPVVSSSIACQLSTSFIDLHFKHCFLQQQQCIYSNMISNIPDRTGQSHILSKMLSDLLLLFENYIYQPDWVSGAANKPMCLLFDSLG